MGRCCLALFAIGLINGCGDATRPSSGRHFQVDKSQSLNDARTGFHTKLIRKVTDGQPLPEPPPEIFRIVEFESNVGPLPAFLTPDPNDGRKHPAIIWITGGDCSTLGDDPWKPAPVANDQTARQFREAGIVMMMPTLRGGNQNPGFHEGLFGEVDDVISAAEFLSKLESVDPQRIYLGGHSSGATLVLLTAECSSRFRAVFSVCPNFDTREYPPQYAHIFRTFDASNEREFDLRAPGLWLHSVQTPVFAFTGTVNDASLADIQIMSRISSNPNVQFFMVTGANHFNILAPTNQLIARKILRDSEEDCNLVFTSDELNEPFSE